MLMIEKRKYTDHKIGHKTTRVWIIHLLQIAYVRQIHKIHIIFINQYILSGKYIVTNTINLGDT